MKKIMTMAAALLLLGTLQAQETIVDGVAAVVGRNIIRYSDGTIKKIMVK